MTTRAIGGRTLWLVLAVWSVVAILVPWLVLAQDAAPVAGETGMVISLVDLADGLDSGALVLLILLAISEGLAMTPWCQQNGIVHALVLALRRATARRSVPVVLLVMLMGLSACSTQGRQAVAKFRADLRTVVVAGCTVEDEVEVTEQEVLRTLPPGSTLADARRKMELASASAEAFCAVADAVRTTRQNP